MSKSEEIHLYINLQSISIKAQMQLESELTKIAQQGIKKLYDMQKGFDIRFDELIQHMKENME